MDVKDRSILALLEDGRARSTAVLATHIGLSQGATLNRLKSLVDRGLIAQIGTSPNDPKRQYMPA